MYFCPFSVPLFSRPDSLLFSPPICSCRTMASAIRRRSVRTPLSSWPCKLRPTSVVLFLPFLLRNRGLLPSPQLRRKRDKNHLQEQQGISCLLHLGRW